MTTSRRADDLRQFLADRAVLARRLSAICRRGRERRRSSTNGRLELGGELSDQHRRRPSLRILHAGLGAQSSKRCGSCAANAASGRSRTATLDPVHVRRAAGDLDHLRQGAPMNASYRGRCRRSTSANRPLWQAMRRASCGCSAAAAAARMRFPASAGARNAARAKARRVAVGGKGHGVRPGACSTAPYFEGFAENPLHGDPGASSTAACACSPIRSGCQRERPAHRHAASRPCSRT